MRFHSNRAALSVAALAVSVTLTAGSARSEDLSFGHMMPENHPVHACGVAGFIKALEDAKVDLNVAVYPAGQTQKDSIEQLDALAAGTLDITLGTPAQLGTRLDKFAVFDLAYIYKDVEMMRKVMKSDVAQALYDELSAAAGLHVIDVGYAGTRHLTANKEIRTPADLNGVKLRVLNAPIWIDNGAALGAVPTPVDFAELYFALQQGVVDAQENPLPTIATGHFDEVQKYVMLTGHAIAPTLLLVSDDVWERLSEPQQKAIEVGGAAFADGMSRCMLEQEQKYLDEWRSGTGRISVFGEVDVEAFRTAAKEALVPKYGDKWDGLYRQILALQE